MQRFLRKYLASFFTAPHTVKKQRTNSEEATKDGRPLMAFRIVRFGRAEGLCGAFAQ